MNSRILLIGGNYFPELTGIGKFNGEMMTWLANAGNDCTVITTYPYYPNWKVQKPYRFRSLWYKKEFIDTGGTDPKKITVYRCPQYVPSIPSGLKRMLLDLSFFISAFIIVCSLMFKRKYSHVMTVVPSFQLGLLAMLYKKVHGAKFIYHIQDLQIDAAKELEMIKSPWLLELLFKIEKYILNQADVISTISEGMVDRIRTKCLKPVLLFPNWVDTNLFFPVNSNRNLREDYGFTQEDKLVLYSGAIGEKQGLDGILIAAKTLQEFSYVKFIICGSGPYKSKLENEARNMGLKNIYFFSLQPLEKLNGFLNMADIHLVIQKANASDLVMPSKLTAILAIGGLAIITTPVNSSLYKIVSTRNMGILIEPERPEDLAEAIETGIRNEASMIKLNARKYAEDFLNIEKVLPRYFQKINSEPELAN